MANTWGELTWGAGSFGLQNDASVPITGNLLTVTQGTATAGISQQISLTGQSLTTSRTVTNYNTYSTDLSTGYSANVCTKTLNATTAPDGTNTATLITTSGATTPQDSYLRYNVTLTPGTQFTTSVYAKAGNSNFLAIRAIQVGSPYPYAWFNLSTGTVGTVQTGLTASISNEGNGWYRCSITYTSESPTVQYNINDIGIAQSTSSNASVNGNSIYLWGIQTNTGSVAQMFVATLGTVPLSQTFPLGIVTVIGTAIVSVTGNQLTVTEGYADPNPDVILTGNQLTTTLGSVSINAEINVGWGRLTWGSLPWGADVTNVTVSLTGQQLTATLASVTPSISINASVTGQNLLTVTEGNVTTLAKQDVFVTGQQLTATLNSVTALGTATVAITGQQLTATLNNVTPLANANVTVTGQLLTASLNSVTPLANANVTVTGQLLTIAKGTPTVAIGQQVSVTGKLLTVIEGVVDPSPDASVSGTQLNALLNSVTPTGNANVTVTGQLLTIAKGTPTVAIGQQIPITGIGLTASLSNVVAGLSISVPITGLALTTQLNSINIQNWKFINTGTPVDWINVDTAA